MDWSKGEIAYAEVIVYAEEYIDYGWGVDQVWHTILIYCLISNRCGEKASSLRWSQPRGTRQMPGRGLSSKHQWQLLPALFRNKWAEGRAKGHLHNSPVVLCWMWTIFNFTLNKEKTQHMRPNFKKRHCKQEEVIMILQTPNNNKLFKMIFSRNQYMFRKSSVFSIGPKKPCPLLKWIGK